jgi:hypothetical protein
MGHITAIHIPMHLACHAGANNDLRAFEGRVPYFDRIIRGQIRGLRFTRWLLQYQYLCAKLIPSHSVYTDEKIVQFNPKIQY